MTDAQTIAANYLTTWNERDAETRANLIARHWTASPRYVDPLMSAEGVEQLSGIIDAVHDRFPGFVFRLVGTPDGHGDYARFGWGLGPENAEPLIEGSDVVQAMDGRIDRVIGFLDRLPAS
jgi:hypothetical protein